MQFLTALKFARSFTLVGLVGLTPTALAQEAVQTHALPEGLSATDWSGIETARDAYRYRVVESGEGYQARNPGQVWTTRFDGRGFLVQPDGGSWSWGFELESYGFEGEHRVPHDLRSSCASGDRLTYDWSAGLEEWFINDSRGLEHGYTLQDRPTRSTNQAGPLTFRLTVKGSLQAQVATGGTSVRFLDSDGATTLTYAGLHVFDANGVTQAASFQGGGDQVLITIEESLAEYPLTIDPIAQLAYLKASNTDWQDHFGTDVAISGDLAVVSSILEDSDATGIDGDQSNNNAANSGAVYIFERIGGVWSQQAYLKASNTDVGDGFGASVAISGEIIVVGARAEASNATGVDGDQSNNLRQYSGAAYIFERIGGVWTQQAYLKASNAGEFDRFGSTVAISGELVAVGAFYEASGSTIVNGNQADNNFAGAGAVYVFERNGGTWSQQAYLKASNTGVQDYLGSSLAVGPDIVIAGAWGDDSDATGFQGDQHNHLAESSGAVFIFERINGVWRLPKYLKASNTGSNDFFGASVSLSGDLLIVGAVGEDSDPLNADPANNATSNSGAAYIFERSGGVWAQQELLKASNADAEDRFGTDVSISGETAVVGASREESNATGVNGNPSNNHLDNSGAAYLFRRSAGAWRESDYLKAANHRASPARFGNSVSLSGQLLLIGAPDESAGGAGVNSDPTVSPISQSGAAFIFDTAAPIANYCGPAELNSWFLSASLGMSGSLTVANNDFTLEATSLPAGVFGYFISSPGQDYVPYPGGSEGVLCLGGGAPIGRHFDSLQNSGITSAIIHTLDLNNIPTPMAPTAIQAGETWNFQCWYRDNNPNPTSNFTNGLSVRFE